MVAISLPEKIANFDGTISHVVVAGTETLIFIKPCNWKKEWITISAKLRELSPSLEKCASLSAVKSGEIYITEVKGTLERSYVIRRPTPDTYSVYLIDKGMQCEVHFDDIFEYPSEMLEFALFSCVCPVFVPSAGQLNIYRALIGHECKCEVESVSRSIVVLGYVRGRLLVKNGGVFQDLQDIGFGEEINNTNSISVGGKSDVLADTTAESKITSWTANVRPDDTSSSELSYHLSLTKKDRYKMQSSGHFLSKREKKVPKGRKRDRAIFGNRTDAEFSVEHNLLTAKTVFSQNVFKEYQPLFVPMTVSGCFNRCDYTLSTFWVIDKAAISTIKKVLNEGAGRLACFPLFQQRENDDEMKQTPCIVQIRENRITKSLYRAVPTNYNWRTKRYSVFLVDCGRFRWVAENAIIDISSMDECDPIRNLAVANIHCRENFTSVLQAKDLYSGESCDVKITGYPYHGVCPVDLLEAGSITNGGLRDTVINQLETDIERIDLSSRRELASGSYQRLMTSAMMEGLNTEDRSRAAQHHYQYYWPTCCAPLVTVPMPVMMMPVPMSTVMMPVPFPRTNISSFAINDNSGHGSTQQENRCSFVNGAHDNEIIDGQHNGSRSLSERWYRSNFAGRREFFSTPSARMRDQKSRYICGEDSG